MNMRCLCLGLTIALTELFTTGQTMAAEAALSIPAVRADTPPLVDGKLEDACWQKAKAITGFRVLSIDDDVRKTSYTKGIDYSIALTAEIRF